MSKILILIPCGGSKRKGGRTIYNADKSILNYLNNSPREHLLMSRRELFKNFSIPPGQDLGDQTDDTTNYMEAYKRYTGMHSQLYRQVSPVSWVKLKKSWEKLDFVMVSALYGLLKYDEPIRWYDKTMKDKVGHQALKVWWREQGLCAILKDYIEKNNFSEVHNLLSNDYNEALKGCFRNFNINYSYHDFSMYRSGSNAYRGAWLDNFIRNF